MRMFSLTHVAPYALHTYTQKKVNLKCNRIGFPVLYKCIDTTNCKQPHNAIAFINRIVDCNGLNRLDFATTSKNGLIEFCICCSIYK